MYYILNNELLKLNIECVKLVYQFWSRTRQIIKQKIKKMTQEVLSWFDSKWNLHPPLVLPFHYDHQEQNTSFVQLTHLISNSSNFHSSLKTHSVFLFKSTTPPHRSKLKNFSLKNCLKTSSLNLITTQPFIYKALQFFPTSLLLIES